MKGSIVLKGQTIRFVADPFSVPPETALSHERRGAVWIQDGRIEAVGAADEVLAAADGAMVINYGDDLIAPGFVDAHAHYPQLGVIASYGKQLLEWLETYTFPAESRFNDPELARQAADFYLDGCARNGTTSAAVYATSHVESVDAFFEAAAARDMRMACGKVLMDRNAPDALCDNPQSGYDDSLSLIERWHERGRAVYAITPRFAPTSSPEQLEAAGALWRRRPSILMQTHLSENRDELAWVKRLFPDDPDYFAVYERFGLAGPGSIFGHAIHLTERERAAFRETGSAIAHCPTSNLFIGSGLFDLEGLRASEQPVSMGLATDVAGGSSLSMFHTMRAAYEIAQLRGFSLHPAQAWHLATQGAAAALRMDRQIGNLAPGMEADVIVIDPASTPLIADRVARAERLEDMLFAQIIMADDRAIRATYVAGRQAYARAVAEGS